MSKFVLFAVFFLLVGVGSFFLFYTSQKDEFESASHLMFRTLMWDKLRVLDVKGKSIPSTIQSLNGAHVKIPGFMIPLEDNRNEATEFLFVPSPMACIHVPPPPLNQTIHVKMASGKSVKVSYGPIWLFGTLLVDQAAGTKENFSYHMIGTATQPYR